MMTKKRLSVLLAVVVFAAVLFTTIAYAASLKDKATSQEYFSWWWKYDGRLEFVPSYVTPQDPGYHLEEGRQVKQGYINYTRKKNGKDVSVIGGRQYTREATDRNSNSVYSVEATATDSLNIFTNQTHFWWDWVYFD